MEEIIGQVAQKVGISADSARGAVETVIAFLKSKLPAAVGSQIDQAIGGGAAPANLGEAAKGLGGLFGK